MSNNIQEIREKQRSPYYTIQYGLGNIYLARFLKEENYWYACAKVWYYGDDYEEYQFFDRPCKVLQKNITRLRCPMNKKRRRSGTCLS
jgi:hypothetical protein